MVSTTVAAVFPGFLVGALSVQVSDDLGVAEAAYGWALGGFFLAAAVASVQVGRLAQRIGPRRQLVGALLGTALAQVLVAVGVRSFEALVAVLAVCGVCNAAAQTAVNLALTEARVERLGLAMALKQSGMPAASLVSGLSVPLLALTLGWRWAFVVGAVGAATVAAVLGGRVWPGEPRPEPSGEPVGSVAPHPSEPVGSVAPHPSESVVAPDPRELVDPSSPEVSTDRADAPPGEASVDSVRADLVAGAVVGGLLAFGAGALNAWLVASGVDAGLGEGVAGVMLSVGAACGIAMRLAWGVRLDDLTTPPFRIAGLLAGLGAVGVALLAVRDPGVHVAVTLLAFAAGWSWPVFTNYGIVRSNRRGAGAATGITQRGVYVGVFSAPVVSGALIEAVGFEMMWVVVAVVMACGAAVALAVADRF